MRISNSEALAETQLALAQLIESGESDCAWLTFEECVVDLIRQCKGAYFCLSVYG